MNSLLALVKENVVFQFYRDGSLYYKTVSGFMFAVPVSDTGSGTFKAVDRGIMFMRWIRKAHLEMMEELKDAQEAPSPDQAPYIPENMQGDGYRG